MHLEERGSGVKNKTYSGQNSSGKYNTHRSWGAKFKKQGIVNWTIKRYQLLPNITSQRSGILWLVGSVASQN